MNTRTLYQVAAVCAVSFSICSNAGHAAGQSPGNPAKRRAAKSEAYLTQLKTIAERLAAQFDVVILVDPAAALSSPPHAPDMKSALEGALDLVAGSNKDLGWRRIYLPPSQVAQSPEKLRAQVRTIEMVGPSGLAVENPAANQAMLVRRVSDSFPKESKAQGLGAKPVYLLYSLSATDDGKTIDERFADLQQQQMNLMNSLTPDQRANPMMQWVQAVQHLDAPTIELIMTPMAQAATQTWTNTPPDQRSEMMGHAMDVLQGYGGGIGEGKGGPRTPRGPRNYLPELIAVANAISAREKVKILVDPAIFVLTRPTAPDSKLGLEPSLNALVPAVEGTTWRKIYLPRSPGITAPSAEKLGAMVRSLESLETRDMLVEDAHNKRSTSLSRYRSGSPELPAGLAAAGLNSEPVYLIYSTVQTDRGVSPQLRYADLQWQQMEMMMQMSPEQLGQAMGNAIQTYQGMDASSKSRVVGLPVIAGMMAIWFPRAAKEAGGLKP